MVLLAVLSLITLSSKGNAEAPSTTVSEPAPIIITIPKEKTPADYIKAAAAKFGADETELLKVGTCESHLGKTTKGDFNGTTYLAYGLFMYHKGTWTRMSKLYNAIYPERNLSIDSIEDQAELTAFIFAKYPSMKREWSTYVAYKNGGTYSFYSKVLKGNYTVVCK